MKKLLLILIVASFVISCSSDSGAPSRDSILLRKIILERDLGQDPNTTIYQYEGRKMKSYSTSDGEAVNFLYTGDLITKVMFYFNGHFGNVTTFYYDSSGRLIQMKTLNNDTGQSQRLTYAYNADNTISVNDYFLDPGEEEVMGTSKYFLDANNELIRAESYHTNGTEIITYTYDDKHNPFKNVVGFNKLFGNLGRNFNIIGIDYSGLNEDVFQDQIREITYNGNDYPETIHIQNSGSTEHYYY